MLSGTELSGSDMEDTVSNLLDTFREAVVSYTGVKKLAIPLDATVTSLSYGDMFTHNLTEHLVMYLDILSTFNNQKCHKPLKTAMSIARYT